MALNKRIVLSFKNSFNQRVSPWRRLLILILKSKIRWRTHSARWNSLWLKRLYYKGSYSAGDLPSRRIFVSTQPSVYLGSWDESYSFVTYISIFRFTCLTGFFLKFCHRKIVDGKLQSNVFNRLNYLPFLQSRMNICNKMRLRNKATGRHKMYLSAETVLR